MLYALLLAELLLTGYAAIYFRTVQWTGVFVLLSLAGWIFTALTTGINDNTQERVLAPALPFLIILKSGFIDKLISKKETTVK